MSRKTPATSGHPKPGYIEASLHGNLMCVADLCSDPQNAREHDARNLESIRKSLEKFGQQKPIVINTDGFVLAGNGTLTAARMLGWEYLAVAKSRLTGNAAKAYTIADNRTTDLSKWHDGDLADQLQALQQDLEFDHTVTGFDDAEIQQLLNEVYDLQAQGSDELEEQEEQPTQFSVVVTCKNGREQKRLLRMLEEKGYVCADLSM
ncbi:MAG: hypothetical protein JKX85_11110 [Phycisphaeraceae bacterium]|nr:hypothetical protein [Phycisphaeraceae bacterium]